MIIYKCDRCEATFNHDSEIKRLAYREENPVRAIDLGDLCMNCIDTLKRDFIKPLPKMAQPQ